MPENLPKKCRGMVIQDNFSVFKYEYVSSLLYQFGLLHKSLPTLCNECKDNFHS